MDEVMHSHVCAAPLEIVWIWSCRMLKRRNSTAGWETSGAEMRSVFATTVTLLHNDAATCDLPLADWSPSNSCSNSLEAELLMRFQCALCAFVLSACRAACINTITSAKSKAQPKFLRFRILFGEAKEVAYFFLRFCVTARLQQFVIHYIPASGGLFM